MAPSFKLWKKSADQEVEETPKMHFLPPTRGYTLHPLAKQTAVPASAATKIRVAILATALVDALGGPVEFKPRFSFPFVETFQPNHNFRDKAGKPLQPGTWTDDTSMALCLARSIAQHGFHEGSQLDAYVKWKDRGELSAIGHCFDIGATTSRALLIHKQSGEDPVTSLRTIEERLSNRHSAGNGSLMRLIPVPLAYWRNPKVASKYGRRSSKTTHPTALTQEICSFWTDAVVQILQKACNGQGGYSKLDFLQYISEYPFEDAPLKAGLSLPATDAVHTNSPATPTDEVRGEEWFWKHHFIPELIASTRDNAEATSTGYLKLPTAKELPSSGFVLYSVFSALYCFFATDNFETGAVMAVNLGGDADTTGAIYAGLAACWYGEELAKQYEKDLLEETVVGSGLFWSRLVRGWRKALVNRELVEKVAEELVKFEKGWILENVGT
ncbi:ADP-ribosylation/Crystallin J1 [Coprinopsis sp. MPI-PUGE-AT-0042]|nr:ADP-ribosylation/Crystallin J1 [Coprinopsis sp. MPI-PUGE-AT-0042]